MNVKKRISMWQNIGVASLDPTLLTRNLTLLYVSRSHCFNIAYLLPWYPAVSSYVDIFSLAYNTCLGTAASIFGITLQLQDVIVLLCLFIYGF